MKEITSHYLRFRPNAGDVTLGQLQPRMMTGLEQARSRFAQGRLAEIILGADVPRSLVQYQRGETVYYAGKTEEALYVVQEGCVKLVSYSAAGKLCIHGIEPPGGIFGVLGLAVPVRSETAIAMRDSLLVRVPLAALFEIDRRQDVLSELLLYLADQVRAQQHLVNTFVTQDSEHRLAVVLLRLGRQLGRRRGGELRIQERLSHEDLAAMVGTTRSRIGFFLKSFRRIGLISDERATLVLDEARVAQFGLGYDDSPGQGFGAGRGPVPSCTLLSRRKGHDSLD